jgi:hypothetical protein
MRFLRADEIMSTVKEYKYFYVKGYDNLDGTDEYVYAFKCYFIDEINGSFNGSDIYHSGGKNDMVDEWTIETKGDMPYITEFKEITKQSHPQFFI